jgi:hypothetical protein
MGIPGWARTAGSSVANSRFVNADLNLTRGNWLDDASSFSAWAGLQKQTLSGTNRQVMTWGNRIISGGAEGEKWLLRNGAERTAVSSFRQLSQHPGKRGVAQALGKAIGGRGAFGILGLGIVAGDYRRAREQGHGVMGSAARAAGQGIRDIMMWKAMRLAVRNPYTAVPALAGVAAGAVFLAKDHGNKYLRQRRMQEFGGQLDSAFQTRQAYTMRQRSLNSMSQSRFNVGRALGNEGIASAMPRARYSNAYGTHMPPMGMY